MAFVIDHGHWLFITAETAEDKVKLEPYWTAADKMKIGSGLRIDKPIIEAFPEAKFMETSEIIRKLELTVDHG